MPGIDLEARCSLEIENDIGRIVSYNGDRLPKLWFNTSVFVSVSE
jgi:hypothetical protein